MESARFFSELFSAMIGDGVKMSVWAPKDGEFSTTAYFEDPAKASEYADSIKDRNVYFGLGVTKAELPASKRPNALQICGIPGFWIDIDIADSGAHKAGNLPATQQDAEELISSALPRHMAPTILTHSGHGLHAYWLFKEPWMFEGEEERVQAAMLIKRFVLSFKYHAAMRGWKLDSVYDLARVLRVPGSINHKVAGMPMTCKIIRIDSENAYNPDEFEKYFVSDEVAMSDDGITSLLSKEKNPLGLMLSAFSSPPHTKFENLMSMEDRFRRSWNMQRSELKDQSLSSYEMSIATFCASYRWSDQEIADTLVSFRMKNAKSDMERKKALRVDYICRTILKAKSKKREDDQNESLGAVLAQSAQAQAGEAVPPTRKQLTDALEVILKIRVEKVVKYEGDIPQFELILEGGDAILLGPVDNLITQRAIRQILAAHRGVLVKQVRAAIWDDYATLLLGMVETRKPSAEDNTEKGALVSCIKQYLESVNIMKDPASGYAAKRPFKIDDRVYMFSSEFRNWTKLNSDPIPRNRLAIIATSLGIKTIPSMKFNKGTSDRPDYTTRTVYDVTEYAKGCSGKEKLDLIEFDEAEPRTGAVQ